MPAGQKRSGALKCSLAVCAIVGAAVLACSTEDNRSTSGGPVITAGSPDASSSEVGGSGSMDAATSKDAGTGPLSSTEIACLTGPDPPTMTTAGCAFRDCYRVKSDSSCTNCPTGAYPLICPNSDIINALPGQCFHTTCWGWESTGPDAGIWGSIYCCSPTPMF